jgi:hypothetical protein
MASAKAIMEAELLSRLVIPPGTKGTVLGETTTRDKRLSPASPPTLSLSLISSSRLSSTSTTAPTTTTPSYPLSLSQSSSLLPLGRLTDWVLKDGGAARWSPCRRVRGWSPSPAASLHGGIVCSMIRQPPHVAVWHRARRPPHAAKPAWTRAGERLASLLAHARLGTRGDAGNLRLLVL